jgi:glucose/arabinose dehydrogenase
MVQGMAIFRNFLVDFLAFIVIALGPSMAEASPSLQISRQEGRSYVFDISDTESLSGCSLEIRRSLSKKLLEDGLGTVIYQKIISEDSARLTALDLPFIKGTSPRRVFFRGVLGCESQIFITNIAPKKFEASIAQGLRLGKWLTAFAENINLKFVAIDAFPALSFPQIVDLQEPNDGSERLFAALQSGQIKVFSKSAGSTNFQDFLDISPKLSLAFEAGLIGLAFHPNYSSNGFFFVHYINSAGQGVISRFSVSASDPNAADESSELILLQFNKPTIIHHGGQLAFGPDGYLYGSIGDGGPQGDPNRTGQLRNDLLGSIIRINVDEQSSGRNYSIPTSNPFVGLSPNIREELFAYGFRNPWRFSFDSQTGELWLGDVGLSDTEEINRVVAGGNYGWNIYEGSQCRVAAVLCKKKNLVKPFYEYSHSVGRSVTGGFVYRGSIYPELFGRYIFGDFAAGSIWALDTNSEKPLAIKVAETGMYISSFAQDLSGELYVLDYGGKIYKLGQ